MKINLVAFDLDGTLVSSHETIYKATLRTLEELHIKKEIPEEPFYKMIGLHFEDIFRKFGFSVPDFEQFIKIYKIVYFDYINLSAVYCGAEETIGDLRSTGIKISLITTKAQDQAKRILSHFNLLDKFDYVMGRRPGIAHKPSPEPLLKICNEFKVAPVNAIIVGDSELDIQCGKNAGSKTCAVTFGYRTKKELQKTEPDFLIDKISDVTYIVNGQK